MLPPVSYFPHISSSGQPPPERKRMNAFVKSIVFIPLAYLVSFLIYQMAVRLGRSDTINITIFTPSVIFSSTQSATRLRGNRDTAPSNVYGDVFVGPSCARDVYLTLHREVVGESVLSESTCKGLLIRDDIILTSKECSQFKFTFDFAGYGLVQAVPHPTLNSRDEMNNSHLGFLEAYPPSHYHFVGQRVHRTPMFLSRRSNFGGDNNSTAMELRRSINPSGVKKTTAIDGGMDVGITCGDQHQPIAHTFLVDGEPIPLGQLATVLPDDILWEETDLVTSKILSHKNHRWYARPISLSHEELTFRRLLKQYKGPPGSISIPAAHDDFIERVIGLCEAVDPRGHRKECFGNYYDRYRDEVPFSGMHFFDWLDFGPGKWLLERNDEFRTLEYMEYDDVCYKEEFNHRTVHYFSDEERSKHEVYIMPSEDGKELIVRYKQTDKLVPESGMDDPHLYMWDLNETMYIVDNTWDRERYGAVKHSGLMNGQPALSAGKAYFGKNGAIWGINYSSGHYKPDIQAVSMMYERFKQRAFNLTALHWVGRQEWSTEDCKYADWEYFKIPGYDAASLNQSCYEVTTSPTWMLKDDV